MLVKIYWSLWGLFVLAVLVLFAAGSLTPLSLVALGFVAFGLTFMGMMGVLPTVVAHPATRKPAVEKTVAVQETRKEQATGFHIFKSA